MRAVVVTAQNRGYTDVDDFAEPVVGRDVLAEAAAWQTDLGQNLMVLATCL